MRINYILTTVFTVILFCFTTASLAGDNGMITKKSNYSAKETIDRLEDVLKKKGITIALRWSHSDKANNVDIPLRPTVLLIFGNPKLGSNFFTSKQTSGIDLPMKALAWEDEKGQVWLTYNDPSYIAKRHGITNRDEVVKKMTGALDKFSSAATGN
ncbi:MAG: DUF302 domain-containing protein [Gammaproteobacteria bacterium]|jgi:uncharacterized protein (DUF302 family)